jgi:hypothetical protein
MVAFCYLARKCGPLATYRRVSRSSAWMIGRCIAVRRSGALFLTWSFFFDGV